MDFIDLSKLSINDIEEIDGYNSIYDSETIEDLLIYLYINENPNISFEELKKNLIEFYFQETDCNLMIKHIKHYQLISNLSILPEIIDIDYITCLNIINNIVLSNHGTNYLYSIYNTKKYININYNN